DSIRDRSNMLHIKSGCMAAIFTFSKSLIESLAKVGVHVWALEGLHYPALTCFQHSIFTTPLKPAGKQLHERTNIDTIQ
ncbi:MAG: hypothetical protein WB444_08545, partial [Gallionella sp.]